MTNSVTLTSSMEEVPVLDLSPGNHDANVSLLDAALRKFGFF